MAKKKIKRPVRLFKDKRSGKYYTKIGNKKIIMGKNVLQKGKINLINNIINKIVTQKEKKKTNQKKRSLFLPKKGNVATPEFNYDPRALLNLIDPQALIPKQAKENVPNEEKKVFEAPPPRTIVVSPAPTRPMTPLQESLNRQRKTTPFPPIREEGDEKDEKKSLFSKFSPFKTKGPSPLAKQLAEQAEKIKNLEHQFNMASESPGHETAYSPRPTPIAFPSLPNVPPPLDRKARRNVLITNQSIPEGSTSLLPSSAREPIMAMSDDDLVEQSKALDRQQETLAQMARELEEIKRPEPPVGVTTRDKAKQIALQERQSAGPAHNTRQKTAGERKGSGEEINVGDPLMDTELMEILSPYKDFVGCVMRDEVGVLLDTMRAQKRYRFGFIFNMSKSSDKPEKDGSLGSHWVAVFVDLIEGKQICFYNSFGEPCPPDVLKELKHFVNECKLPYLIKFKHNTQVNQLSRSNRCGYHCADFLITMLKGGTFKEATHYKEFTTQAEKGAAKKEKEFKKFGYI